MMTPAWILEVFAAVMLVVAGASAARLAGARPWRRGAVVTDTDISHLLMGIAMAGMLAPGLTTLPNDGWAVVFGVLMAWFGYRVVRDYQASGARALAAGHCAPHLAHCAAMVYMFLAIAVPAAGASPGTSGMTGMSALDVPTLALAFGLILVGYAIWDLDQLSSLWQSPAVAVAGAAAPAPAGAWAVAAGTVAGTVAAGTGSVAGAGGGAAADSPAGSGGAGPDRAAGRTSPALTAVLNSDGTAVGCRIAMGVTMALMLFVMI